MTNAMGRFILAAKIFNYRICSNERPGAFFFQQSFLKKLLIKNAINSHFSFIFLLQGLREGVH
jgi:hypothetical protein